MTDNEVKIIPQRRKFSPCVSEIIVISIRGELSIE